MNSRERTCMAIAHEEPDRPPVSATLTPEASAVLRKEFGHEEVDLGYLMGNDLIKTTVGIENSYYMSEAPEYTCPFGVVWKNTQNYTGAYTEIIGGALRDDDGGEKLRAYRIPDPDDPSLYAHVYDAVKRYGKEKYIVGSCQCSIFETAWYLHGLEDTLIDMEDNEEYIDELFDKIMQFPMRAGLHMIEAGVDMVWLGDDIATQRGMLISPENWRRYLKERYAQIFAAFREARKDIVIAYHSCGNCVDVLDELADIGLDVINPIQPLAMDPYMVKRRFGKRLTLFGAIDVQKLMPFGTKEEIIQTVRDYKKYLGAHGGYILSPAHHLQSDTSLENMLAFYETAKEVTAYDDRYC